MAYEAGWMDIFIFVMDDDFRFSYILLSKSF